MLARQALHQLNDTPSPPCLLAGNLQRNFACGRQVCRGNKCPAARDLYVCSAFRERFWESQYFVLLATVALARDVIIRASSLGNVLIFPGATKSSLSSGGSASGNYGPDLRVCPQTHS